MLKNPPVTEQSRAAETVKQIIQQVNSTAQIIMRTRRDGLPAVPARPAQTLANGHIIPATEEQPALTPAAFQSELEKVPENVAILDALAVALG